MFFISCTYSLVKINKYTTFYIKLQDVETTIEATVISDIIEKQYSYSCKVKYKNTKLLLTIKKDKNKNIDIKYGDLIKIKGTFELPKKATNYKGFDYANYLKTKKIYGIFKTKTTDINFIQKNNTNLVLLYSNKIKSYISNNIKKILPERTAGVLIGILIGDVNYIERDIIESFKLSNISHILSVSGLHVAYVILGFKFIFDKIKINKRLNYSLLIFILFMFCSVTEFSPGVVRAALTSTIMLSSKIFYRKSNSLNSLFIALYLILIYNPYSLLDIGLQLSFAGTLGIILFNKKIFDKLEIYIKNKYINESLSVCVSAQSLIFPIMLLQFNNISFTFFIANLIITPIMGVIVIAGFIIAIFAPITNFLAVILNSLVNLLILISEFSSKIPFSNVILSTPNIIFVIGYYVLIFKHKFFKKIINVMLIFTIIINVYNILPKNLKIYFVDVGQRR